MTASHLIDLGLSNALAATILALVALAASRLTRSAPVAHFLWALVILKLLTPPLFEVRLPVGAGLLGPREEPDVDISLPAPVESPEPGLPAAEIASSETDDDARVEVPAPQLVEDGPPPRAPVALVQPSLRLPPPAAAPPGPATWRIPSARELLAAVWLCGSLVWYGLAASRLLRFRRLLSRARPAPEELVEEVRLAALALGFRRVPEVVILSARLSPLVWAIGRHATLVLPEELTGSLTAPQRKTLIAHEVAHLLRRDHWLRWVEMLALGLYWWLPVAWWARRELRVAEEECCDAWVQWAFPGERREYARTLLRTVDFLSRGAAAAPEGASGMAQVSSLERRFRMILNGRSIRRLPGPSRAALVLFAAFVLPWAAGFTAEDDPDSVVKLGEKDPLSPAPRGKIRITLDRDAKAGRTLFQVNDRETTKGELGAAVAVAKDESRKQGTEKLAVTVEAASDVPWQDVVHVMDVLKKEKLEKVDFASSDGAVAVKTNVIAIPLKGKGFVRVEGNEVSLMGPDEKATQWKTTLGGGLKGAKIWVEDNRLVLGTPERIVVLDLPTGKVIEEKKPGPEDKFDPKPGTGKPGVDKPEWFKNKVDPTARSLVVQGGGLQVASAPGPSAGSPVDVVQLGSALVEARGAARLAENRLSMIDSKEEVGLVSRGERSAEEIQLHTAMKKIELLQRIAKSAFKGMESEIKALNEIEEMARRRYEAGQTGEDAVLSLTLRRVHAQTLASLLEELLRE